MSVGLCMLFPKDKDPLEKLDSDKRMENSSLFLFHIDMKLRRNFLRLAEEPEAVEKIFSRRDQSDLKVGLIN